MKGMVILLVVLGHVVAREPPAGHAWWDTLRTVIYAFHMPAFLYLGGLVLAHTGTLQMPLYGYAQYVRRRAVRLLVPFFGLGLFVVIGKLALARELGTPGFVVMTSRTSYELVRKCARVGIPALATISAPTSLALQLADEAGMQLWGFCRPPSAVRYV